MSEHLGPVEFLAVEFPSGSVDAAGFEQVLAQVDAGTVFVLDIEFITRPDGGPARTVSAESLDGDGSLGLVAVGGAATGLLAQDDIDAIGAALQPGSVAVVVLYEDRTMDAALTAWEAAGGRVVLEGTLDEHELDLALNA